MTIPSRNRPHQPGASAPTRRALASAVFAACVLLAPGLATAGGNQLRDLAAATGLTPAEVQMVLGARTPFPEYFTSYDRARRQLEQALGPVRFRELMAGRAIVLDNGQRFALAQR